MRSVLFAPADRPDLVAKLGRSRPDVAVVDLEDGVRPGAPVDLHETAAAVTDLREAADGLAVFVRVRPAGGAGFDDDLAWAEALPADGVVAPKTEGQDALAGLAARLPVIAGIETAEGVERASEIARAGVAAVYFGAEDFVTDMRGVRTESGLEVLYARSRVVLAARLAGIHAIDQAVLEIRDQARFEADAALGRSLGYAGKLCVHPDQVPIANRAFGPSPEDLDQAARIVAAWDAAGRGAVEVDGRMIDEPIVRRARALLDLDN